MPEEFIMLTDIGAIEDEVVEKVKRVRLLIMDVDGVMTDGRILYTDHGVEIKAFNVKDGLAVKLLRKAGIDSAIITARKSIAVKQRSSELAINLMYQGVADKRDAFSEILKKTGLNPDEIAFIGDDLQDLPVMNKVGFTAAPADAVADVRARVDYITQVEGGRGAVREVAEIILKTQGKWDELMKQYFE